MKCAVILYLVPRNRELSIACGERIPTATQHPATSQPFDLPPRAAQYSFQVCPHIHNKTTTFNKTTTLSTTHCSSDTHRSHNESSVGGGGTKLVALSLVEVDVQHSQDGAPDLQEQKHYRDHGQLHIGPLGLGLELLGEGTHLEGR